MSDKTISGNPLSNEVACCLTAIALVSCGHWVGGIAALVLLALLEIL